MGFFDFLTGTKEKQGQRSILGPEQQGLYQQLLGAAQAPGSGGAFGNAADYYRDLLSDNSQTFQSMQVPEMRRFNEDIIPGLAEQFAGMGSGGLSSSGFRNAAVNAGTDLSERLGAIRAQLRQQGAAGLTGIGQQGLGQYNENYTRPGEAGISQFIGPAIGSFGSAVGSPFLGALGGAAGNAVTGWLGGSTKGTSPVYGNNQNAKPNAGNGFNLPNFGQR